ncbi:MAG: carbohydrate kinase [Bacteroidaceae bacterium]|nr:carbohydrate kinase [Bacteroidaceae bacterium]
MRQIIGIGETVYDIIFQNGQPRAAVPGGSSFNSCISLGRIGYAPVFISETGDDTIGRTILSFMRENGVSTSKVSVVTESKSPLSLAFLNENNDAEYLFYKDHDGDRFEFDYPEINKDDIVFFGSYYSINPVIRPKFAAFLDYARHRGALLYYDVNFRSSHADEKMKLMANILENFEYADIVRGSADDFEILFGERDADKLFRNQVSFYCPRFICTSGAGNVELRTRSISKSYATQQVPTVSTIGAGDSFNAGIIHSLMQNNICAESLDQLLEQQWDPLIAMGQSFAMNVCQSVYNYIDADFAKSLSK